MINLDKLVVADIETLHNCFILNVRDVKTGSKKEFVLFNDKEYEDQPLKLFNFLKNCVKNNYTLITYNGLRFDLQVLHYFYDWCLDKQDPLYQFESSFIISKLYEKAQAIIAVQEDNEEMFKYLVSEKDLFMPTIDLMKQLHYDSKAKRTSLKWIEFSMQYPTIQDMPISHEDDITLEDIPTVLEYCWNDVDATYEFFNNVKHETELRLQMSKEYKIPLINDSEPSMVRKIFGKFICNEMGITYSKLKELKTIRKDIAFKDIIFSYVRFITDEFKEVLAVFKHTTLDCNPHSKDKFKHTFNFKGMDIEFGLGGIHACTKSGVYTPTEEEVIEDADVTSFYPMLAIKNNIRPEHLGEAFNKVYPMIFEERQKYPKKDPRNYVYKIVLNSAYGLSKEINSYLYDPKFTYSITLNGQLSLLMLVEALNMAIPGIEFLQMNTDGITYKYNKQYTEKVRKICAWWEKTTQLSLEYFYYSKMVINDVNNYLAVYLNGDVKKKGLFETNMAYHKNPSALIIPKALATFFIEDIPVQDYIKNKENSIFDYCLGVKKKSNFSLDLIRNYNFAEVIEPQQKVCRYYVSEQSETSGLLVKNFNDGRRVSVEANTQVEPLYTIKPDMYEVNRYNINYEYYIKECNKIIENIKPSTVQQSLF